MLATIVVLGLCACLAPFLEEGMATWQPLLYGLPIRAFNLPYMNRDILLRIHRLSSAPIYVSDLLT